MIYLASIPRAPCQGPTTLTPQSSPPTCSRHTPSAQGGLPQVESLQPVTPPFLAILALAGGPSSFGKGQAGGSHGRTVSLPLPPPQGWLSRDWGILPQPPVCLIPTPLLTASAISAPPSLTPPPHPRVRAHYPFSHLQQSAWVRDGRGTGNGQPAGWKAVLVPEGAGQTAATQAGV